MLCNINLLFYKIYIVNNYLCILSDIGFEVIDISIEKELVDELNES